MKLVVVSAYFSGHGGGIEVVASKLAQGLASRDWHVVWCAGLAASDPIPSGQDQPAGLCHVPTRSHDPIEHLLGLPFPWWGWPACVSLWREIRTASVVHLHDYLYMPTLLAFVMAKLAGKPIVLTQHIGAIPFKSRMARTVLSLLNKTLGRMVLGQVDQVVFVSRTVQEYFESMFAFRRPAMLVPNGVDHEVFAVTGEPTRSARLRFLFVGRFVEKKGIGLLQHCQDLAGVEWVFVGWGPQTPRSWPTPHRFELHDKLRGAEVAAQYQHADLLVLPSTGEGFPLVVQESLACGTPVLVSHEVANAFEQSDPSCVFMVDLREANPEQAVRRTLEALAADPERLRRARPSAKKLGMQWSWDATVSRYDRVLRGVVHTGDSTA